MSPQRRAAAIVFAGIGALVLVLLATPMGWPLPKWAGHVSWVAIPLVGAAAISGRAMFVDMGVTRFARKGVAVAAIGSMAMLAGAVLGSDSPPVFDPMALWDGALRPGLLEELIFRGFAFGLLTKIAGWSFRSAMLLTGLSFGLMHIPSAVMSGHLDQVWGTAALTAAGGCWYAWLFARWDRSLWVPITAHVCMNAAWVATSAGPTAAGGGAGATWGRIAAIVLITVATGRLTPQPTATPGPDTTV